MSNFVKALAQFIQPIPIVLAVITFSLGTGIADFLGYPIDWLAHWVGVISVLLLLSGGYLLDAFFSLNSRMQGADKDVPLVTEKFPLENFKRAILQLALMMLAVFAALFVLMLANGNINSIAIIFFGIFFFLLLIFAVPPFRLSKTGYGELVETIFIVNLTPAVALLLQISEPHRLLLMLTMPLTGLMLAMMLAKALPTYGKDIMKARINLMTAIGWERGMQLHNWLILISYFIIAMTLLFAMPWRLVWPCMLTLPIGLYQIWQMRQITLGIKPNWKMLNLTSIALVGVTAYLITLSLWIG